MPLPEPPLHHGPMAIVGLACRFPGAADPAAYWRLIADGAVAIRQTPPGRWDLRRFYDPDKDKPTKLYVDRAGYLEQDLEGFDAAFFGMSPREAAALDPQQRLLLELTWEAMEDAGRQPADRRGSQTGVYVGAFTVDHLVLQNRIANWPAFGPHTAQGTTLGMLANRISHVFDLHGPSLTIDTACSSSLVALHYACRDLQAGVCQEAIVAGVNLMLAPDTTMTMCKGRFLAADGRSKAFQEGGDGYGRGEGAGVLVLKPLARAMADGDEVYALIRGSAINHDGHTNGISAPNPEAQGALLARVYGGLALGPDDVDYVEAHGTGTAAGDRAEVAALGRWLAGRTRPAPVWLGSVKSQIGHLEAAAGMASVIKAALMLQARHVPAGRPGRPLAELDALRGVLEVPAEAAPWPAGPARVAVNGFGYGGTNAHVVVEAAAIAPPPALPDGPWILPLAASTPEARTALAGRMAEALHAAPERARDLIAAAARFRSPQAHRLAVVAADPGQLVDRLRAHVERGEAVGLWTGSAGPTRRPVFVYTGMGPQWWGMAAGLYHEEPVFRAAVDEVDALFEPLAGWSLVAELLAGEDRSRMDACEVSQPANFALQVGLTALWRAYGVEPAAIVGHSAGEIAALHAAGVYDLADATLIAYHRARLQQRPAGRGAALALGVGREEAERLVASFPGLCLGAVNGPDATMVAGDRPAVDALADRLAEECRFHRRLAVDIAYHSHHMDELKDELMEALAPLSPRPPRLPLVSTVTGAWATEADRFDAAYWWRNVREPVLFEPAVAALAAAGHALFVELGPHPVLAQAIREGAPAVDVVASQRRDAAGRAGLARAIAALYVAGGPVAWDRIFPDASRRVPGLPAYPWQRERLWTETQEARRHRLGPGEARVLPGQRLAEPVPTWEIELTPGYLPYLPDHRVGGRVVLPAAAMVEACLSAARDELGRPELTLVDLRVERMLALEGDRLLRVTVERGTGEVALWSAAAGSKADWTQHAATRAFALPAGLRGGQVDLAALRARCLAPGEVGALYDRLAERGLDYGPSFRRIAAFWLGDGEAIVELTAGSTPGGPFLCDPAPLDAALQAASALEGGRQDGPARVPVGFDRVDYHGGDARWIHVDFRAGTALRLLDEAGRIVVAADGVRFRELPPAPVALAADDLHVVRWRPAPWPSATATPARVWHVPPGGPADGGRTAARAALAMLQRLAADPEPVVVVTRGAWLARPGDRVEDVSAAAVWGLVRVARAEHPALRLVLADLPAAPDARDLEALERLRTADDEPEAAIRDGQRLVPRLTALAGAALERQAWRPWTPNEAEAVVAIAPAPGAGLAPVFQRQPIRPPGPREVTLEVLACDVGPEDLFALGRWQPDAASKPSPFGREAVARVAAAGRDAGPWQVGDRVVVVTSGGLMATRAVVSVDQALLLPAPPHLRALDALTVRRRVLAHEVLVRRARLRPGDAVLLAGSLDDWLDALVVGARALGAIALVATDWPERREALLALGASEVVPTDEVEGLRRDGRPLQAIVCDGGQLSRCAPLLAEDGCLVRLLDARGAVRPRLELPHGASYVELAPGRLFEPGPTRARRVEDALAAIPGEPLAGPVALPFAALDEAFARASDRTRPRAVAVAHGQQPLRARGPGFQVRPDRTYLLTGGLGGLGLALAERLAERGARHLVLWGRRSPPPALPPALAAFVAAGGTLRCQQADVSSPDAVAAALGELRADLPPLAGVFHLAGVLDDGLLAELTPARLDAVLAPKAAGAWNLHEATSGDALDAFVLVASISGVLGNAGQGAYAAANTYLDALAQHRRALGLPGLALDLGPVADVGMLARDEATARHLARRGLVPVPAARAIEALERLLELDDVPQAAAMQADWLAWTAHGVPALLAELSARRVDGTDSALGRLAELAPGARLDAVLAGVRDVLGGVLRVPPERLAPSQELGGLGLDSLMVLEFAHAVQRRFGVDYRATHALAGPSVERVAREILALLGL